MSFAKIASTQKYSNDKDVEWICGLPFRTPKYKTEEFMNVGELTDRLIYLKRRYEIYYPDDNDINLACNILDRLPQYITVSDLLQQLKEKNLREKQKIFNI